MILLIPVVLLLLGVVGVFVFDQSLSRVDALVDYPGRIGDTPGTNYLLVGSDGRVGLTPEQESELATGGDVGPERTDTIMLLHRPESGRPVLVSIPRDSYLNIPGWGQDKVNAAFAIGNAPLLVQTVEEATGVHIDHYVEIGFSGFAALTDAVGGVEVCLDAPIIDPLAGIDLPAGCQTLNGPQALGFVRTRASALADIDRVRNQREFMSALMGKATSLGTLLNPFRMYSLMKDGSAALEVGEGDHLWDLAFLAWAMRGGVDSTSVPIGYFADVDGSGNVLVWDEANAARLWGAIAADQPVPADLIPPP